MKVSRQEFKTTRRKVQSELQSNHSPIFAHLPNLNVQDKKLLNQYAQQLNYCVFEGQCKFSENSQANYKDITIFILQ
jgi:hypothetical protein